MLSICYLNLINALIRNVLIIMVRRINIFGGPGVGKSTAAYAFANLKRDGYNIELVTEYVKKWVWLNIKPDGFDQVYLFAKQLRAEETPLKNGCDLIITDSPLLLLDVYSDTLMSKSLMQVQEMFTETYPELNIYIHRNDNSQFQYVDVGRFQTLEQAKEIDKKILQKLELYKGNNYITCDTLGGDPSLHVFLTIKRVLEGKLHG